MDCYSAMTNIAYHILVNATSFWMTHLCCHCPAVFFLDNTECTPHLHNHIIDIALILSTCASKEIMRLRLLVPFSLTEPFTGVLFAFGWAVVELTMRHVQSPVNLIIQPPHGASGRSAACPSLRRPTRGY